MLRIFLAIEVGIVVTTIVNFVWLTIVWIFPCAIIPTFLLCAGSKVQLPEKFAGAEAA